MSVYVEAYPVFACTGTNSFPKPLSPKEEQDCLARMRDGDVTARDTLVEHNLRLVAHIVKKYATGNDTEDFISIGTVGLMKAVLSFHPDKNTRLATYAARCIENEIFVPAKNTAAMSPYKSPSPAIKTATKSPSSIPFLSRKHPSATPWKKIANYKPYPPSSIPYPNGKNKCSSSAMVWTAAKSDPSGRWPTPWAFPVPISAASKKRPSKPCARPWRPKSCCFNPFFQKRKPFVFPRRAYIPSSFSKKGFSSHSDLFTFFFPFSLLFSLALVTSSQPFIHFCMMDKPSLPYSSKYRASASMVMVPS